MKTDSVVSTEISVVTRLRFLKASPKRCSPGGLLLAKRAHIA
jgi:hypothetical protein